jgi:hypothetical protein
MDALFLGLESRRARVPTAGLNREMLLAKKFIGFNRELLVKNMPALPPSLGSKLSVGVTNVFVPRTCISDALEEITHATPVFSSPKGNGFIGRFPKTFTDVKAIMRQCFGDQETIELKLIDPPGIRVLHVVDEPSSPRGVIAWLGMVSPRKTGTPTLALNLTCDRFWGTEADHLTIGIPLNVRLLDRKEYWLSTEDQAKLIPSTSYIE